MQDQGYASFLSDTMFLLLLFAFADIECFRSKIKTKAKFFFSFTENTFCK